MYVCRCVCVFCQMYPNYKACLSFNRIVASCVHVIEARLNEDKSYRELMKVSNHAIFSNKIMYLMKT